MSAGSSQPAHHPLTAQEHADLNTFMDAQPLAVLEWMASSFPVWEKQGTTLVAAEQALIASSSQKPSEYVQAAEDPILQISLTLDTCPLLTATHAGLMAVPQDANRLAAAKGQILQMIIAYLKSIGIGSGKIISILPQIIAIITQAATSGGAINWQQVIALILQIFKPTPAPNPAPVKP